MTQIARALSRATNQIGRISDTPRLDAELLMAEALHIDRDRLILAPPDRDPPERFWDLVERRKMGEPVAYITGRRAFWNIELHVGPGVLIPRPDSEVLIASALEHFEGTEGPKRILDLGTGRLRPLRCPPGRVTSVLWNDSGTAFVYAHTPEGTDRWDIRLGTPEGRDTLLLSRPGTWFPMDWSPDGARLAIQRYVSSSESELFLLPLAGGEVTQVLPKDGPQYYDHAVFVRLPETGRLDGRAGRAGQAGLTGLAFTSDRIGAFHRLYLLAPEDSQPRALSPPVPWDVEWAAAGGDRR